MEAEIQVLLEVWRETAQAPVWLNAPDLAAALDRLDRAEARSRQQRD